MVLSELPVRWNSASKTGSDGSANSL